MTKRWMITNTTIVTMNEQNPILKNAHLGVEGDTIAWIDSSIPETWAEDASIYRINASDRVILPGLVNTHGHAAMSLLRGYSDDVSLQVWLEEKMWPIENAWGAEDIRWGTWLSILEMVRGGTTTFVDMYSFMDEVAAAVEKSGMRACLTRGVIGLCPPDIQTEKLNEARQFAKDWHGKANGRITTMMAPHAPYTCPPDYISRIVDVAHELNLPIHTHLAETKREVESHIAQYGKRPVAHLDELGVFARPTLVAHAVHVTDEEIALFARKNVHVSHNPGSNLKLASGIAPIPSMLKAGVRVSLGTDSAASNNNLDQFEEMRLAALLHKGVSGDPTAVPAWAALKMGTIEGARSIWLNDVGMLKAGMKADFISLDANRAHFQPQADWISHIIYSGNAADVCDVWINGETIMRNRDLRTIDEERIRFEVNRLMLRFQPLAASPVLL